MTVSFKDKGTEDVFNGENTKAARKTCPESLWKIAARKLDQLDSVTTLGELRIPPGNRLEACRATAKGNTAFASTNNFGYALRGQIPVPTKLRLWTTTNR